MGGFCVPRALPHRFAIVPARERCDGNLNEGNIGQRVEHARSAVRETESLEEWTDRCYPVRGGPGAGGQTHRVAYAPISAVLMCERIHSYVYIYIYLYIYKVVTHRKYRDNGRLELLSSIVEKSGGYRALPSLTPPARPRFLSFLPRQPRGSPGRGLRAVAAGSSTRVIGKEESSILTARRDPGEPITTRLSCWCPGQG